MLSIDKQALEHALAKTMNWNFDLAKEKLWNQKNGQVKKLIVQSMTIKNIWH